MFKKLITFFPLLLCLFLSASLVFAADDESALFSDSARPDVLLVFDKSSSMSRGLDNSKARCDDGCVAPDCCRFIIGKRAVKDMLDYKRDGIINEADEALGVRFGYMTFWDKDTAGDPWSGTVRVGDRNGKTGNKGIIGTPYATLWEAFSKEVQYSGTPLVDALKEAKTYMQQHRDADTEGNACRKYFVILVSDGWDSVFKCPNNPNGPYRNRATVAMAKKLFNEKKSYDGKKTYEEGFPVYVIGLYEETEDTDIKCSNMLNWVAYYGGTDSPDDNEGSVSAFVPPDDECNCSYSDPDPRDYSLKGYAFVASTPEKLTKAFEDIISKVTKAGYSFSNVSTASARTEDENFLYQASFKPEAGEPFWQGSIKKYSISLTDGSLGANPVDAGEKLKAKNAADRKIYTRTDGTVRLFNTNLDKKYLGASDDDERRKIVGFVRGESDYNKEYWKLGDTFHSEVRVIGSPSAYFDDPRSPSAFQTFRDSKKGRERIVVAGANDGQLHVFSASTMEEKWSFIPPNLLPKLKTITHTEHPVPADKRAHQYFVDGPTTAADVWLGSGDGTNKSAADWKTILIVGEGRGVRDASGNPKFLWSSSIDCDLGFNTEYSPQYPFYCGYHALDVTETGSLSPTYLWRIRTWGVPAAAYLSEPWSRMAVGRVKIDGDEKWVGFIGGGLNGKGFFVIDLGPGIPGDLKGGRILWSYTRSDNAAMDYGIPASPAVVDVDNDGFIDTAYVGDRGGNIWRFKFCTGADGNTCDTSDWQGGLFFQATSGVIRPIFTTAAVSKDSSGSLWVFWGTGDKLNPTDPNAQEKFYALSDDDRTTTYNINNLTNLGPTGSFSGKKPGWYLTLGGSGEKMLADPAVFGGVVLFTTYTPTATGSNLCAAGGTAKLYALAMMPLVIDGVTYNPGAGLLSAGSPSNKDGGAKSIVIGKGIPGAPVISQKPGGGSPTDLYVPISGAAGEGTGMVTGGQLGDNPLSKRLRETTPRSQMIHWRDMRLTP